MYIFFLNCRFSDFKPVLEKANWWVVDLVFISHCDTLVNKHQPPLTVLQITQILTKKALVPSPYKNDKKNYYPHTSRDWFYSFFTF